MRRLVFAAAAVILLLTLSASAQEETPKVEVFGGYSYGGGTAHGWNGSVAGNVNRWLGLVADFGGIWQQLAGLSTLPLPTHLAIAFTRDFHLAFAFDLALDLALDLGGARGIALARAVDLDLDLDFNLDNALVLALDRNRALDLARNLAGNIDRVRSRSHSHARALDLALNISLDLAFDLNLGNVDCRAFVLVLAIACAHACVLLLMLDHSEAALSDELTDSQQVVKGLLAASDDPVKRWVTLLDDLLALANAPTVRAALLAQRKVAARILEYAYLSSNEDERKSRFSRWRRRLPFRKETRSEAGASRRGLLEPHWWFQIIIAREEGKLAAWEGIRIAREQVSAEAQGGGKQQDAWGREELDKYLGQD